VLSQESDIVVFGWYQSCGNLIAELDEVSSAIHGDVVAITNYSADLHISPNWDVIQKDGIIVEALTDVFPKSTYFQYIITG